MSLGRARKRDANEREIIVALRRLGAFVQQLDGPGVPDLLVAYGNRLHLMEVKEPSRADGTGHRRSSSGRPELTPTQVDWWDSWSGETFCAPVIVRSPAEALAALERG